jgi:hypothetical protein
MTKKKTNQPRYLTLRDLDTLYRFVVNQTSPLLDELDRRLWFNIAGRWCKLHIALHLVTLDTEVKDFSPFHRELDKSFYGTMHDIARNLS